MLGAFCEYAHVKHHLLHINLCTNIWAMSKEKDWFSTVAGRRITVVEISKLLDMNRNTATTRMQDGLSSDEIITLARRLHINPVMALEELGKVTIKEIFDYVDSDGTLVATASTDQLIFHLADTSLSLGQKRELLKRVSPQLERSDELAERRANRVVADPTYNPLTSVADSSPDEDQLRGEHDDDDHIP